MDRDRGGGSRWWVQLALLLLVSLGARLAHLDSDPPLDGARDLSLTVDSSWYVGAAIDWASGRETADPRGYDPPLFGALARGVFLVFGPTRWAANLLGVLLSLVTIGLTAAAARRAHGAATGLVAGALLSFSYPFFVHSRTPGIYVALAALAAGILYLEASRRDRRSPAEDGAGGTALGVTLGLRSPPRLLAHGASWGLVAVGALGVKFSFLLHGLALALSRGVPDWWSKPRPRRLGLALGLPALGLILFLAWQSGWLHVQVHKTLEYLRVGDGLLAIPYRVLTLENRLGLLALAPVLVSLAVIGAARFQTRPVDRLATAMVFLPVALLAVLAYSPLRYLLPAFPALALLAARTVTSLLERTAPVARQERPALVLRAARIAAVAYLLLQLTLAVTDPPAATFLTAAVTAALVTSILIEVGAGHAGKWTPHWRRGLAMACLALVLALNVLRSGQALAAAEYSVPAAGREVAALVDPAAHLTGPFAHVLTYESAQRRTYLPDLHFGGGRLARELRTAGFTHLAMDISDDAGRIRLAFQNDGAPLRLVHEFFIRRQKVHLYRFPWADQMVPPTEFERGIRAIQDGDPVSAEKHLRRAQRTHPESSAAASALGALLVLRGNLQDALTLLIAALERNPAEVSAMRSLIQIYLRVGDLPRARALLEKVAGLDPEDREAADLLERLASVGTD